MNPEQPWYGKKAPHGLKTYPAWSTAPAPAHEKPPEPRWIARLVIACIGFGVLGFLWGVFGQK